jgi:DNA-binding Xre family transcriptional regulator
MNMPLRWKLNTLLQQNDITPYRVIKDTGLSPNTVYGIVRNETETVHGQVLTKLLRYLEQNLGRPLSHEEVLVWETELINNG